MVLSHLPDASWTYFPAVESLQGTKEIHLSDFGPCSVVCAIITKDFHRFQIHGE